MAINWYRFQYSLSNGTYGFGGKIWIAADTEDEAQGKVEEEIFNLLPCAKEMMFQINLVEKMVEHSGLPLEAAGRFVTIE